MNKTVTTLTKTSSPNEKITSSIYNVTTMLGHGGNILKNH